MIRSAILADLDALAELYIRSWNHSVRELLPKVALAQRTLGYRRRYWEVELCKAGGPLEPLVLELDGLIVGVANVGAAEVKNVYVEPGYLGRGLGSQLMTAAEAQLCAAGFTQLTLWVFEGNEDARRFYERRGWVANSVRRLEPIDETEHELAVVQYEKRF